MSTRKVNDFIAQELNLFMQDTRENKIYSLGYAAGLYGLYQMIVADHGKDNAYEYMKHLIENNGYSGEYLKKIIELHNEENSMADDIADKLSKYIGDRK